MNRYRISFLTILAALLISGCAKRQNPWDLQSAINAAPKGLAEVVIELPQKKIRLPRTLLIPAGTRVILIGKNTTLYGAEPLIRVEGEFVGSYLTMQGGVVSYEAVSKFENCRLHGNGSSTAFTVICGGQMVVRNCFVGGFGKAFSVTGGPTVSFKDVYFWGNSSLGTLLSGSLTMEGCEIEGTPVIGADAGSTLGIEKCHPQVMIQTD